MNMKLVLFKDASRKRESAMNVYPCCKCLWSNEPQRVDSELIKINVIEYRGTIKTLQ